VLHEPPDPAAFLHEVKRALRPSCRILVVDWQKRPTEQGPPVEHRLSEDETRSLLSADGFSVAALDIPTPDAYALLATRF
jgi:hypothetical protein